MGAEDNLKRYAVDRLRAAGMHVDKNHGSNVSAGRPDLTGCWSGWYLAIELKAPGRPRRGTALQEHELASVRTAGGWAGVVNDRAQIDALISHWPWVCRHCLTPVVPAGDHGLRCPACDNDGGLSGRL